MTQYNPNPNATSNTNGWVTSASEGNEPLGASGVQITATSAGLRITKPAGQVAYVQTPNFSTPVSFQPVLAGWKVRRNFSGSGWFKSMSLNAISDDAGVASKNYNSAQNVWNFFSDSGVFVTLPNFVFTAKSGDSMLTAAFDHVHLTLYLGVEACDFTLTTARIYRVYDSDIPADVVLDASDASPSFTYVDNSLSVSYAHAGTADEGVNQITLVCPGVTVTAKDGTTGPLTGNTVVANNTGGTDAPGVLAFPIAGTYPLQSTVRFANPNTPYTVPSYTSGTTYSVTVPTGPFLADFASLVNYLDVSVDSARSVFPSNDPPSSYTWTWGDGSASSSGAQQTHTYAAAGTYTVTLTMASAATGRTATVSKSVTPVALPNPGNYFTPIRDLLSVVFSPSITATGTTYAWAFGDGGTDTVQLPTHVYAAEGTYSVTLTVNGTQTVTQTVVVHAARRPFRLADVVSLEVALPWGTGVAYNRLPNPNGDQGAWGWLTPLTGTYVSSSATATATDDHGVPGAKLIYHSSGSGTQSWYSQAVAVTVGQYVSAQLTVPYVEGYYRLTVEALSAAGAVLGSSTTTAYSNTAALQRTAAYLLPASTVTARLRIDFYSNTSAGTPAAGKIMQYRRAMLATAATATPLATNPYLEGVVWQNIIGPASSIDIGRSALNVGTLSATVMDSSYDPAVSPTIRPGQRVRVRAVTEDASGTVSQDYLFEGKLTGASASYNPRRAASDPKSTTVVLSATDSTTPLTQTAAPNGVALISELPAVLEGAGVPYEINGGSGQIPTASVVSYNPSASVLDQVAITRDSTGSYAYVSRSGVLVALDVPHMPTAPVGIVSEQAYSAVDASFSTNTVINSVMINWLRFKPASSDYAPAAGTTPAVGTPATVTPIPYGPYEDAASIAQWGRRSTSQPFTIQGFAESEAAVATRAAAILAANATPVRMISGATLPIRYLEDVTRSRALLDIYDPVTLQYARTGTNTLARVTSIKHAITPRGWKVVLGFSPAGAVAAPQLVSAPPSTAAAVSAAGAPGKVRATAAATGALTTSTTATDIPGVTTTVTVTSTTQQFLVHLDVVSSTAIALLTVQLVADGTALPAQIQVALNVGSAGVFTASRSFLVTGLATGSRVIKAQAYSATAGAHTIKATHTTLVIAEL